MFRRGPLFRPPPDGLPVVLGHPPAPFESIRIDIFSSVKINIRKQITNPDDLYCILNFVFELITISNLFMIKNILNLLTTIQF